MLLTEQTAGRLRAVPGAAIRLGAPLSEYTRFGIGGPADIYVEAPAASFAEALGIARSSGLPYTVIGGGTNLVVADAGFRGIVLRLVSDAITADGLSVRVAAGAVLQTLVDFTVDRGLAGLETMTGIPGSAGAAVYGNAGAYGHSIAELVRSVRFLDGAETREIDNAGCEFHYRESIFKRNKNWIILSAVLSMRQGETAVLRAKADGILNTRNKKYPPSMKCAGSIFKNFLLADLPAEVAAQVPGTSIIEGKVPSAWFLESVGAKGMREGGIHVADYHANLIYNAGGGTASELIGVIRELKRRVRERWGIAIEEEVQYVGLS